MKETIKEAQGKVQVTMMNETAANADELKIQTAEALEDAARKLRMADGPAREEDVRRIMQNVEDRVNQFKSDVGTQYRNVEAGYHKSVEPVENMIIEHPIPAVLVAAGLGVILGMFIFRPRD
jgi:ElaB/YqjD/DUF883 family membrane-anchored ribosome-binding protein